MEPGHVIDAKYRVDTTLGEGGMGVVLAATHLHIGSKVAIKLLRPRALAIPEAAQRFLREARAAGRLRGEHVGRVIDVGELPDRGPYIVMELLHGIDLASHLAQGPLHPSLAATYITQACEGLAEAHALGMIHRDIKPANLFVARRPDGTELIKVVDFGVATAAYGDFDRGLTSTQAILGSPSYMSPEQLRASKDVDARSDVWALGVTLYELLSCTKPFCGETLTALTLAIATEPHEPLVKAPPGLVEIIDRCLAKAPSDRYRDVGELAEALAPFVDNGAVLAGRVRNTLAQVAAHAAPEAARGVVSPTPLVSQREPASAPLVADSTTLGLTAGESAVGKVPRRSSWPWLVALAVACAVLVGAAFVIRGNDDHGAPPSRAPAAQPSAPQPLPVPVPSVVDVEPTVDAAPSTNRETATPARSETSAPSRTRPRPPRTTPPPAPTPVPPPASSTESAITTPPRSDDKPAIEPTIEPTRPPPGCMPNDPTCGL